MKSLRLYLDISKAEEPKTPSAGASTKPPSTGSMKGPSKKDRGLRYATAEEIAAGGLTVVERAERGSGGYVRAGAKKTKSPEQKVERKQSDVPSETPKAPTSAETPKGVFTDPTKVELKPEDRAEAAKHAREVLKDPELADKIESQGKDKPEGQGKTPPKKKEPTRGEVGEEISQVRRQLRASTKARQKKEQEQVSSKKKKEEEVISQARKELKEKQKAKEKASKEEQKAKSAEEKGVIKQAKLVLKEKHKARQRAEKEAAKAEEKVKQEKAKTQAKEEAVKPKTASDHAIIEGHAADAGSVLENLKSHVENNPDMPEDVKARMGTVVSALEEHTKQGTIPTPEEKRELNSLRKLAGDYAKKPYEEVVAEATAQAPSNDLEHSQLASHKASASDLINNAQAHLESGDLSEEHRAKLESALKVLENHKNLNTVPTTDQVKELSAVKKQLGTHAKAPKDQSESTRIGDSDKAKASSSSKFPSGRAEALGRQFEQGASDTSTGGAALGSASVEYAAEGAVAAGHHLLNPNDEDETSPETIKDKKYGMNKGLYLEQLNKAISTSSSSSAGDAVSGARGSHRYNQSFNRRTSGVSGDFHPTDDDPEVGKRWPEGDEDELEQEQQDYSRQQKESGVVKASSDSVEMLKSISSNINSVISSLSPRTEEKQFLVEECGFTEEQVIKGRAQIRGPYKQKFDEWLCKRLSSAVNDLKRSLF